MEIYIIYRKEVALGKEHSSLIRVLKLEGKMKVVREICIAGNVIDVTIKVPSGRHSRQRGKRVNITKEAVQKNNDVQAAKNLARIINANFDKDSWHDTLTYAIAPSVAEAKKTFNNFISRLRYSMNKMKMELKWVMTTEYTGKRIHHHFITNAPVELVREKWNGGKVLPRPFDDSANYFRLADYIIKETAKTFRECDSFGSRYTHSRNLNIPEVKTEEVDERMLFQDPKPFKGYYIDQDTIRRYEHPITGLEHLEYMMISESVSPRLKKYYKGKKRKKENYNRYINYTEEQITFY